jgi:hypothetical protein
MDALISLIELLIDAVINKGGFFEGKKSASENKMKK